MKKSLTILPLATIVLTFGFSRVGATDITACGNLGPGSYVLKQNLTAPTNTNCLVITGGPVTIDLNGFTITGDNLHNTTNGVFANSAGLVTVRNGTLRGFYRGIYGPGPGMVIDGVRAINDAFGFYVGDGAKVENSYVAGSNGGLGGIVAGNDAVLSNDIVTNNTAWALANGGTLGDNAQVSDSVFINNFASGLTVGNNATITRCTFRHNQRGLSAGTNASVSLSSAYNNSAAGIQTHGGATVSYNTSSDNGSGLGFHGGFVGTGASTYTGNSATENHGQGFTVEQATMVNNVASGNSQKGFRNSGSSTYQGNTAIGNGGDNFHSAEPSTFTGNTSSNSAGAGFAVVCPTNLVGNTAGQNSQGSLVVTSGSGCTSVNNLF